MKIKLTFVALFFVQVFCDDKSKLQQIDPYIVGGIDAEPEQ